MKTVIVGIDEAGRGALAGPVVAGACVLTPSLKRSNLIQDSKQLTPQERDSAFSWIERHCTFGIGIVEHSFVDSDGILAATERAMQLALAQIARTITPTYVLVDGRDRFWFDYSHSSIIGGDASEPCIAAGSIVAKVTRDRRMISYDKDFPHFGFAQHKGYGTAEHFSALERHGPCPLHRRSFLRNVATTIGAAVPQGRRGS